MRGEKGILQLGEAFDRGGETQQSPCGFQLERSLSRKLYEKSKGGIAQFRFPWLADNLMSEHSSSDGSERARDVNWFPVAVAAAEDADDEGVLSSPNSTVSFFR